MYRRLRPHIHQFACYLGSGAAAVLLDFGSYFFFLRIGMWYIVANTVSNILGFFSAFLFHKYLVFRRDGKFANHFFRYCCLSTVNVALQTLLLIMLVEYLSFPTGLAKVVSFLLSVLGNFFLYRSFVYV